MLCLRCKRQLAGKQSKYCGEYCCRLYLKAAYRRRNRGKINTYHRWYRFFKGREKNLRGPIKKFKNLISNKCRLCKTQKNLTLNHIRPLSAGGENIPSNLETLCKACNIKEYNRLVAVALKYYFDNKKG